MLEAPSIIPRRSKPLNMREPGRHAVTTRLTDHSQPIRRSAMASTILDRYGLPVIVGANLKSAARKLKAEKSMASVVQMLGAE
jgi:hypothetical protein